jgi:hypothetical protein
MGDQPTTCWTETHSHWEEIYCILIIFYTSGHCITSYLPIAIVLLLCMYITLLSSNCKYRCSVCPCISDWQRVVITVFTSRTIPVLSIYGGSWVALLTARSGLRLHRPRQCVSLNLNPFHRTSSVYCVNCVHVLYVCTLGSCIPLPMHITSTYAYA